MTTISIKDIFKVGIGPSSSHTMGPWQATLNFLNCLKSQNQLEQVQEIKIILWNSLAKTGLGHATDMGILLGLAGESFTTIDHQDIPQKIAKIKKEKKVPLLGGKHWIPFDLKEHLIFELELDKEKHPNQIDFQVITHKGTIIKDTFFSVGGGFIERREGEKEVLTHSSRNDRKFPFPIEKAKDIISYHHTHQMEIDEIILANELSYLTREELRDFINLIRETMLDSIYCGCHTQGVLPGGLNVNRRAFSLNQKFLQGKKYTNRKEWLEILHQEKKDFRNVVKFISCFALAVNEVNAAMGRIVTAPTNGAAGVIPAVYMYYCCFVNLQINFEQTQSFFLVASEIGSLFKKNASISAASGGCQAEIGVSSSMAAAALTHVLGGKIEQTMMAAEIAMEHHLGLTCDPIKGLVQIPCIERNSMGAIKAITASEIALNSDPQKAVVELDDVIKTMWETAKDMNNKYKETSEGGLAINIPLNVIEC